MTVTDCCPCTEFLLPPKCKFTLLLSLFDREKIQKETTPNQEGVGKQWEKRSILFPYWIWTTTTTITETKWMNEWMRIRIPPPQIANKEFIYLCTAVAAAASPDRRKKKKSRGKCEWMKKLEWKRRRRLHFTKKRLWKKVNQRASAGRGFFARVVEIIIITQFQFALGEIVCRLEGKGGGGGGCTPGRRWIHLHAQSAAAARLNQSKVREQKWASEYQCSTCLQLCLPCWTNLKNNCTNWKWLRLDGKEKEDGRERKRRGKNMETDRIRKGGRAHTHTHTHTHCSHLMSLTFDSN